MFHTPRTTRATPAPLASVETTERWRATGSTTAQLNRRHAAKKDSALASGICTSGRAFLRGIRASASPCHIEMRLGPVA